MELKLVERHANDKSCVLLIVPYGIETENDSTLFNFENLLIVPYGIETLLKISLKCVFKGLLIVPYGIETCFSSEGFPHIIPF